MLTNKLNKEVPSTLFKYGSNFDFLKEILLEDKIYFPRRLELNDAFDLLVKDSSLVEKAIVTELKATNWDKKSKEYSTIWKEFVNDVDAPDGSNFRESANKITQDLDDMYLRIYCLTDSQYNKLLWSHYANSYKGYCIEFNFKKESQIPYNFTNRIFQVNYDKDESDERIDVSKISNNSVPYTTKSRNWEYEKEYRIVVHNPDGTEKLWRNIHPETLSAIYFGNRTSPEEIAQIMAIVKDKKLKHIRLYQAEIKRGSLTFKELTRI